jgi:hypothetical protein
LDGKQIGDALRRAIGYLLISQLETGEFPSVISDRVDLQGWRTPDSCVFVSAGVLHALRFLGGSTLVSMRDRTVMFLLEEMIAPGIWCYWTRRSAKKIPADVDDTASVLNALDAHLPAHTLAAGREAIIANRNEDGLFKTWIAPNEAKNDVDSVVNANVVACLGRCPETREACTYLCNLLRNGKVSESYWYYAHDASFYYAVSRAVAILDDKATVLRELLAQRLNLSVSGTRSILEIALEACALLTIGLRDTAAVVERIDHIMQTQRSDGSWAQYGYYTGPEAPAPRSVWFGSASLTTAICVEALSHYALKTGISLRRYRIK